VPFDQGTNASLHERRAAAVPRGVANACPIYADRAENAELWDVEGRRYIDFAGGIAVLNTGHRHPKIMAAAGAQEDRFTHTSFQVVPYEPYIALAERLNALAPGDFAKKTILFTTGAEAIENAVKIARAATGRPGVIAFSGAFHGRTMMTLGLTGKVNPYKAHFGPFPGEIFRAPFPNALHGVTVEAALAGLESLFRTDAEADRVAAMIVEPVQGEGGYYIAPFEFLRELRRICDAHGILLISDEIQSGFARTGKWFAIEHSGVAPDLIAVAKSLAGGFPLSGVIGRAEVMDAVPPGGLGGTYGGNPVACAAGLAAIQVIEDEGLLGRSLALGERITGRLRDMAQSNRVPYVGEVRGLGAMVAVEFVKDRSTGAPHPELTKALTTKAAQNGLILLSCGVHANVVRIMVPLTASDAIVDEGLDIMERSLREVVATA
jgi:4-aminobutyrate aminotransferase / (S)-3-amino-2-methylpropionate transaminase / 5-aminovalerate transaminase